MEKHLKHIKMVISTNSLILIGTLCFCCEKTISFSLAKHTLVLNFPIDIYEIKQLNTTLTRAVMEY